MRRMLVVGSLSLAFGTALACGERPPGAPSAATAPEGKAIGPSETEPSDENVNSEAGERLARPKRLQKPCGGDSNTGVWRADSEEVMVLEHNFFTGSRAFRADCSILSDAQLKLLEGLELLPGKKSPIPCRTDPTQFTIEVKGTDGNVRSYQASSNFGTCEGDPAEYITMNSIRSFMRSVPCIKSRQIRAHPNPPENTPSVGVDDGCEHGFFGGPQWVRVSVEYPGTYTFEGIDCAHPGARFTLYEPNGETILSRGRPQPAPGCWHIKRKLKQPGQYLLKAEGETNGDYFIRMSSSD